jgi:protein TonB
MAGGELALDRIRLPLAFSVTGHAVALALLILFAAETPPAPIPSMPGGIEVILGQSLQQAEAVPAPETPTQPVPAAGAELPPQAAAVADPERMDEATEAPPTPPVTTETEVPPPPRRKPAVRQPPKHATPEPERRRARVSVAAPLPSQFVAAPPVSTAGTQYPVGQSSAANLGPAPVPGPDATASYRAMISAWLESHKRYPESARERGEEGSAALRFRIDRSGRVLDYSYASTGYADLDAGLDEMMRGAQLPPFPPGMTASRIEVSLTMRFNLAR